MEETTTSPAPTTTTEFRLSAKEKVGYAFGDTASCLYFNTWQQYLLFFYTDVFGIAAAAAGFMLMITRFGDTVVDPVMGVVADRTKTKHGKFRPWLRWMAFPMAATAVLMFYTPHLSGSGKLVYAYITYSLALIAYSAINIPYSALMGVMSPNPADRTELSSYRFLGAFSGNLIVQYTLLRMVKFFGHGEAPSNKMVGFPIAMTVLGLLACAFFFTTFFMTKERVSPPKAQRASLKADLWDLVRNGPWLALCGIGILTLIWVSIRNGAMVYYFKYYVGNEDMTSDFLTLGTIGTLAGVYCTKYFEKFLRGKRSTYIVCNLLSAGFLFWFYTLKPTEHTMMYVLNVVSSFVGGPLMPITWAMFADTADYAEWKFRRRSTGLIFSAGTFSQKMGWSVGSGLAGILLERYGFHSNMVASEQTQHGILLLTSFIPAVACIVTALAVFLYRINGDIARRMAVDLAERRAAEGTIRL